jgi:hypothetical protein
VAKERFQAAVKDFNEERTGSRTIEVQRVHQSEMTIDTMFVHERNRGSRSPMTFVERCILATELLSTSFNFISESERRKTPSGTVGTDIVFEIDKAGVDKIEFLNGHLNLPFSNMKQPVHRVPKGYNSSVDKGRRRDNSAIEGRDNSETGRETTLCVRDNSDKEGRDVGRRDKSSNRRGRQRHDHSGRRHEREAKAVKRPSEENENPPKASKRKRRHYLTEIDRSEMTKAADNLVRKFKLAHLAQMPNILTAAVQAAGRFVDQHGLAEGDSVRSLVSSALYALHVARSEPQDVIVMQIFADAAQESSHQSQPFPQLLHLLAKGAEVFFLQGIEDYDELRKRLNSLRQSNRQSSKKYSFNDFKNLQIKPSLNNNRLIQYIKENKN